MSKAKMYMNERVVCEDGFSFSCQANEGAYCSPRESFSTWYEEVEIGFPSDSDSVIDEYIEGMGYVDDARPDNSVYPYVPSKVVYVLIAKHGGIKSGQVPRGVPEYGVTHCKQNSQAPMEG